MRIARSQRLAAAFLAAFLTLVSDGHAQGRHPSDPRLAPRTASQLQQEAAATQNAILSLYSSGQGLRAENMIDFSMIGRQVLVDQIQTSLTQQVQIQLNQTDLQYSVAKNVVSITFNWQKRFLRQAGLVPQLHSGHAQFLWHRDAQGWHLVGVHGDSPFLP